MTPIAAILDGVGLSQREAADFLRVRPDTVASWSRVRNPNRCPAGALAELHSLAMRQAEAATHLAQTYHEAVDRTGDAPAAVHLADLDDDAARAIGWPCAGAYRAVVRRAWEMLPAGTAVLLVNAGDPAVAGARQARQFTA